MPANCPYCSSDTEKIEIETSASPYYFCSICGVVFKDLSQESHVDLTETTYTVQSWGTDRQRSIDAHGPRIKKTIQWFQSQAPLNVTDKYLDVGAGVGVLIHYLAQDYSINQNSYFSLV